ncbi:MAG: hypothetical protein ABSE95_15330 [Thermodesulfobacteriota bacterium]|jgi:DNA-binding Lrp family transcriptional regulator
MGRPKLKMDEMAILEMRGMGKPINEISRGLNVSTVALSRRIAELKNEEGILTKYRELQGLQLSGLQFRFLEAMVPERLNEASLLDLVRCFAVLNKAEMKFEGKGSKVKIHGLVEYLMEIEREEKKDSQI